MSTGEAGLRGWVDKRVNTFRSGKKELVKPWSPDAGETVMTVTSVWIRKQERIEHVSILEH